MDDILKVLARHNPGLSKAALRAAGWLGRREIVRLVVGPDAGPQAENASSDRAGQQDGPANLGDADPE